MFLALVMLLSLAACGGSDTTDTAETSNEAAETNRVEASTAVQSTDLSALYPDAVYVTVSDDGVTTEDDSITVTNDIVYYEEGHDFTYGEGSAADEHSAEEAAKHTVVTITQPGTYVLSGTMSAGQIAVDLGEDAEEDPDAVVTLVLNGLDITCTVAPAVIFYNVYECGSKDIDDATYNVDTAGAGANVVIPDGSVNNVNGSYVARIYKSYELSDDGTEVVSNKKLHKYDGAFYSKMSMNVDGGEEGTGVLNITAENEGLDAELHLTINGGVINITSGNDGINTNEDEISVTTINGGTVNILITGTTGEGDGIDSNGWLVINGGQVYAQACGTSGDAGIDSDLGIYLNGGTVMASGNMLDAVAGGSATYVVLQMQQSVKNQTVVLKNADGQALMSYENSNAYQYLILSSDALAAGDYTLWMGETQLGYGSTGGMMGMGGGMGGQRPDGQTGELPEGMTMPDDAGDFDPSTMEMPEGMELPEGMEIPEGMENMGDRSQMQMPTDGQMPEGGQGEGMQGGMGGQRPDGQDGQMPEGMTKPDDAGEFDPSTMEIPEGMELPEGMDGMQGGGRGQFGDGQTTDGTMSDVFTLSRGGNTFSGVAEYVAAETTEA